VRGARRSSEQGPRPPERDLEYNVLYLGAAARWRLLISAAAHRGCARGERWLQLPGAPGFLAERSVVPSGQQPPSQICMLIPAPAGGQPCTMIACMHPVSTFLYKLTETD
jgi:hypothetical protein